MSGFDLLVDYADDWDDEQANEQAEGKTIGGAAFIDGIETAIVFAKRYPELVDELEIFLRRKRRAAGITDDGPLDEQVDRLAAVDGPIQ